MVVIAINGGDYDDEDDDNEYSDDEGEYDDDDNEYSDDDDRVGIGSSGIGTEKEKQFKLHS